MNSYELSRDWFDWCFDNPEKINPNHTAMYFFIIEHCNRLGWKEKFGLPMQMTKDAIGISNYRTFSKTFNDLVDWGFLKVHQKSKNQYSSNIIGIVKNTKAKSKALDKAMQNHSQKQVHGIVGIDKQLNNITSPAFQKFEDDESILICMSNENWILEVERIYKVERTKILFALNEFKSHRITTGKDEPTTIKEFKSHFTNWVRVKKQYQTKSEKL